MIKNLKKKKNYLKVRHVRMDYKNDIIFVQNIWKIKNYKIEQKGIDLLTWVIGIGRQTNKNQIKQDQIIPRKRTFKKTFRMRIWKII